MKRRRHAWATRAYSAGRRAAHGMKEPAIGLGAGVGAAILDDKVLKENETIQEHWWARGAIFAVAGWLVRRQFAGWGGPAGFGLLGVGGFLLAEAYMAEDATEKPAKDKDAGAVWGRRAWQDAGQVLNDVFAPNAAGLDPATMAYQQYAE